MPTLRVIVEGVDAALAGVPGNHPKAVLISESGRRYVVPFAPMLERSGYAPRFTEFERVGRVGISSKAGMNLRSLRCEFTAVGRNADGYADAQVSIEDELATIRAMAADGERVHWEGYGPSESGVFRITEMSETDERRRHGTNQITQAKVSLTLTEASEAVPHVGPVTGGVQ